jgi:hypothetical protein
MKILSGLFLTAVLIFFAGASAVFAAELRDIHFPTETSAAFQDDFGDGRPGGRSHEANDLMGKKMTPLYSAIDGVVSDLEIPEASWGYAITLKDSDGYTYHYIHVNNDNPGTDDGQGGVDHAYAPFISVGAPVRRGQMIGWMGDSGNAENVCSHLHFEIRRPDGTAINPYLSLMAALGKSAAVSTSFVSPVSVSAAAASLAEKQKFIFKKNLEFKQEDADVKQLQKFLNANGFAVSASGAGSPGKETNYFGSATKAALVKFQRAKKISPTSGFFGPLTMAVANK